MPRRAHIHRAISRAAAALAAVTGAAVVLTAIAAVAAAILPTASRARPIVLAKPSPPAVQPPSGRPFVPIQGDWEGTANGFAASFNLVLDPTRRPRAGAPAYGIQDLVLLRPTGCPPSAAHYGESMLRGRRPSALGRHGGLGLTRLGLRGAITGSRSATLSAGYSLHGCRGTITWHMHPAVRRTVADGSWTIHWPSGERSSFHVQANGRLATAIRLPRSIAACNGLSGTVDVFIGAHGGSAISHDGVTLKLRFGNEHASGTLAAAGCAGGAARVTAARTGG